MDDVGSNFLSAKTCAKEHKMSMKGTHWECAHTRQRPKRHMTSETKLLSPLLAFPEQATCQSPLQSVWVLLAPSCPWCTYKSSRHVKMHWSLTKGHREEIVEHKRHVHVLHPVSSNSYLCLCSIKAILSKSIRCYLYVGQGLTFSRKQQWSPRTLT